MALHNDDSSSPQDGGPLASTKASLDRIKQQLTTSGRFLLQGSLLKRSETLRKWNQRWFTLDPTTGKMEYRIERGDLVPKGSISFDAGSTIIVSPINFQGVQKYDGCCIFIQTMAKKEYFLCAETRGAARAWVSTLQAAQLVLKAHKEAVNSLGGSGTAKLGTVAAVVAGANATAKEAAKEIAVAMQASAVKPDISQGSDVPMDDLSIMKETLRVKDEELHQMAKEMRARDATIKELAERLSETAEAAEAAASAAHIMDKERKAARTDIAKLRRDLDEKLRYSALDLKAVEEKLLTAERSRDEALQEARMWRAELAKAREHAVVMEAALVRAEESARQVVADTKFNLKARLNEEAAALSAKNVTGKEGDLFQYHLKNVASCSEDADNALHQPPVVTDFENQANVSYLSEYVNPPLGAETASHSGETEAQVPVGITSSVQCEADEQKVNPDPNTVETQESAFDGSKVLAGTEDFTSYTVMLQNNELYSSGESLK